MAAGSWALRYEAVAGERTDGGFAPHCPLVVLSFTQHGARGAGSLPQRSKGTEDSSSDPADVSRLRDLNKSFPIEWQPG